MQKLVDATDKCCNSLNLSLTKNCNILPTNVALSRNKIRIKVEKLLAKLNDLVDSSSENKNTDAKSIKNDVTKISSLA